MTEPARVVCADPPWRFGDKLPGPTRGAEKQYPCMSFAELCQYPLPPIAKDARLFMWRVASMQQEAFDLVKAWGFTVKAEMVWRKQTATGKRFFGMGRQVRMEHEVALICTRGKPPPVKCKSIRSVFDAPAGRHSAKPEGFYDLVEQLCDGPYVELFARRVRPGWQCIGNEIAEAA